MNDRENQATQRAHKLFRQEPQRWDSDVAWRKEYTAQEEDRRRRNTKLRALRLARDAAAPPTKPSKKAAPRRG